MLTYAELIELRNNLASNKIDVLFAKTLCYKDFKEGQRSWHTKDWKERRDKIIKDKCQMRDIDKRLFFMFYKEIIT
jgi:hypothetical protein